MLEEDTFLKTINTTDNATDFSLEPLHPHYLYNISVSAVTVGVGPFSIPESVRMPPTGMPDLDHLLTSDTCVIYLQHLLVHQLESVLYPLALCYTL